jgi:hypothetical protein
VRAFTRIASPTDFKEWVLGFYGKISNELAKLPTMLAERKSQDGRASMCETAPTSRDRG